MPTDITVDGSIVTDTQAVGPECSGCGNTITDTPRDCGQCDVCCQHTTCTSCNARRHSRSLRSPVLFPYVIQCLELNGDPACECCDNCNDHCECYHCGNCGDRSTDSMCEHCNDCNGCCNCRDCLDCGSTHSRDDMVNGYCYDCNDDDGEYDEKQPGEPFRALTRADLTLFNCSRLVGVELEYNNLDNRSVLSKWSSKWRAGDHEDGSCGREVVTAPIAGNHLVNCLTSLGVAMREAGATADDRCGIHVHVDASDYRWHDMYRLLWVYNKVEALLYLLAGQQRIDNTYCKPCGTEYVSALSNIDRKGQILAVAYNTPAEDKYDPTVQGYHVVSASKSARKYVREVKPGKKDGGRYRGLNILPWLVARRLKKPDNTVEFRIHRNSLDSNRVLGWAKVCARLVDFCAKTSDKEISNLPKSALKTLIMIAPDCKEWIIDRVKDWRKVTTSVPKDSKECSTRNSKHRRRVVFSNGTCMTLNQYTANKRDRVNNIVPPNVQVEPVESTTVRWPVVNRHILQPGVSMAGKSFSQTYMNRLNLTGFNFEGANFYSADLANCNFNKTNLKGADLRGAYTNRCTFEGANLTGALRNMNDPAIKGWIIWYNETIGVNSLVSEEDYKKLRSGKQLDKKIKEKSVYDNVSPTDTIRFALGGGVVTGDGAVGYTYVGPPIGSSSVPGSIPSIPCTCDSCRRFGATLGPATTFDTPAE